jgi:DNA-binding NarL/FixJ family response regulator
MACSVLIVDDNPIVRRSMRNLLQRSLDCKISGEAENGMVAVQRVEELRPDVVLLDLQMPVMDGLQAAKEIKRLSPNTKILLFTMHYSEQVKESALSIGVDDVLPKSSGSIQIIASLKNACGRMAEP